MQASAAKPPLTAVSGTPIARIGLGCMGMSEFYGARDDEGSLAVLLEAFDLGYRHVDTADFYGGGHNEELLGRFIAGIGSQRAELLLATKCGLRKNSAGTGVEINSRPEYVRAACEGSLARLGVDYVDLLYLHRRSPEVPIEETVGAMAELVKEGKCRHLGLSEVSADTLRRAHTVHPVSALQSEYSLWTRDVEDELLDLTRRLNIALVAYSPVGRGFLTGTLTSHRLAETGDIRRQLPRFRDDNFQQNQGLLGVIAEVAAELGQVEMSQVALAWVLAQGRHVLAVPGTRRSRHLQSNLAAQQVELGADQIERLARAFAPGAVQGARYPEMLLRTVNV